MREHRLCGLLLRFAVVDLDKWEVVAGAIAGIFPRMSWTLLSPWYLIY